MKTRYIDYFLLVSLILSRKILGWNRETNARFEVLTEILLKNQVFWETMLRGLVNSMAA
jgi:hypothetical protein